MDTMDWKRAPLTLIIFNAFVPRGKGAHFIQLLVIRMLCPSAMGIRMFYHVVASRGMHQILHIYNVTVFPDVVFFWLLHYQPHMDKVIYIQFNTLYLGNCTVLLKQVQCTKPDLISAIIHRCKCWK